MATGRFLSVSIAEDDRLSRLSLEAEFVYLKTIPHLDRDGMISGKPGLLYSKACPLREELFGKTGQLIDEWVEVGLVIRFESDEGPVLFFPGFSKNNNLPHYHRERPSRFPPPPGYARTPKGLLRQETRIRDELQDTVQDSLHEKGGFLGSEGKGREVEVKDQIKGGIAHARMAEPSEPSPPPSLLIFQEFCTKPVNQPQIKAISSAVTDLELWRRVLTEWSVRGYNMGNVKGLLDWYRDGIPPVNRNGTHGTHTKHGEADGGYDPPKLDPAIERQFAERAARKASQAS